MGKQYKQLGLKERSEIQEGLDRGDSFRAIGRLIGRSASTVSREVRENRTVRSFKPRKAACRDRSWCKRAGVCGDCVREGAFCSGCDARDCRDECAAYARQASCDRLNAAPWVCNGCRKNRYGRNRANRYVYDAGAAQKASIAPQRIPQGHRDGPRRGPRSPCPTSRTASPAGCPPTRYRCCTRTSSG